MSDLIWKLAQVSTETFIWDQVLFSCSCRTAVFWILYYFGQWKHVKNMFYSPFEAFGENKWTNPLIGHQLNNKILLPFVLSSCATEQSEMMTVFYVT